MRVKVKIRIKYIPQFKSMYVCVCMYVCACVFMCVFACMLNVILLHIANYAWVCV